MKIKHVHMLGGFLFGMFITQVVIHGVFGSLDYQQKLVIGMICLSLLSLWLMITFKE